MENMKQGSMKRIFSVMMYMIVFVFSVYSIMQIRYFYATEKPAVIDGKFMVFFLESQKITHDDFIILKLTLFFAIAVLSFILMVTNFFYYQNPTLERNMMYRLDKDIRQIKRNNRGQ